VGLPRRKALHATASCLEESEWVGRWEPQPNGLTGGRSDSLWPTGPPGLLRSRRSRLDGRELSAN
jgi:hypothetical protein